MKRFFKAIWSRRYFLAFLFIWSVLVFVSAIWNLHENFRGTYARALVEAETIFQHNLAYRRWNSMHGGVYARISELNQPNPYILGPGRDLTTTDGTELTIINPFQMTKQAYDLLRQQSPQLAVLNRTVSLDPLNSENEADEWETAALHAFEDGSGSLHEITTIDGAPYMRLISPYVTERRCLGCHEEQGYEIDDIRGGMSIAVPMQPYYKAAVSSRKIVVKTHLFLWLLGFGTITLLFTGLRRSQNTLLEEEKKFRVVSEFAYNFEYWIDEKKRLAFLSPSCKRITGYSREDFLNNSQLMFDIIHPDDKILFKNHLLKFEEPAHKDMEYRIVTKGGAVRWLSHTCNPIYSGSQFLGRRGSNIDITERKVLEEKLQQAKKLEYLGQFAGGVAHDFNNVLTSISTLTHLLHDHVDHDNTVLNEYTDNIIIAAKLGQNLTSNLLLFGSQRRMDLRKSGINELVTKMEKILHVIVGNSVDCKISLNPAEQQVMADPHRIEQVLINLITNARDAMPEGGEISIETAAVLLAHPQSSVSGEIPAGNYARLSVSDSGTGIDEITLEHIFEPFYSTKSGNKGTGLGLFIVHDIIRQHDAFLEIETSPKCGTTFHIYFPVVGKGSTPVKEEQPPPRQEITGDGRTVLLVDDDWMIRKSLSIFFGNRGYSVLEADSGEKAIRQYQQHAGKIDLVVLDVMLPGKNGREVYDALKELDDSVKVLFFSGSDAETLAEIGIDPDNLNFLAKPFDMELFAARLEELIGSWENKK